MGPGGTDGNEPPAARLTTERIAADPLLATPLAEDADKMAKYSAPTIADVFASARDDLAHLSSPGSGWSNSPSAPDDAPAQWPEAPLLPEAASATTTGVSNVRLERTPVKEVSTEVSAARDPAWVEHDPSLSVDPQSVKLNKSELADAEADLRKAKREVERLGSLENEDLPKRPMRISRISQISADHAADPEWSREFIFEQQTPPAVSGEQPDAPARVVPAKKAHTKEHPGHTAAASVGHSHAAASRDAIFFAETQPKRPFDEIAEEREQRYRLANNQIVNERERRLEQAQEKRAHEKDMEKRLAQAQRKQNFEGGDATLEAFGWQEAVRTHDNEKYKLGPLPTSSTTTTPAPVPLHFDKCKDSNSLPGLNVKQQRALDKIKTRYPCSVLYKYDLPGRRSHTASDIINQKLASSIKGSGAGTKNNATTQEMAKSLKNIKDENEDSSKCRWGKTGMDGHLLYTAHLEVNSFAYWSGELQHYLYTRIIQLFPTSILCIYNKKY